jgi:hypothetical protein
LGLADTLKGSHDVQRERDEPIVIDIGQLALGLRPDELIRVERRVPGKAVHVDAGMSLEKGPHVPTPMNLPAIPQQDEWSPQVAEQLAEERDETSAPVMLRTWRSKYNPSRWRRGTMVSAEMTETLSRQ